MSLGEDATALLPETQRHVIAALDGLPLEIKAGQSLTITITSFQSSYGYPRSTPGPARCRHPNSPGSGP